MKREHYNVIQGADSFYYSGNSTGVLICHGFNGTPQSVEEIGRKYADQGYTVYAPRLWGHGTSEHDMQNACYQDWLQSLSDGFHYLKRSCSDIFLVGQSMGGTLCLHTAAKLLQPNGLVLINAAINDVGYMDIKEAAEFIEEGSPDIKAPGVYEITYPKVPFTAVNELLSLMKKTSRCLKSIHCPVLLITSRIDHVVPPANSDYIFNSISSPVKERVILENSYHVASMDYDKEEIVQQSCNFFRRNAELQHV
ncbi:alpha/beta fold hydrolase [Bacillus lacus]|uniref:Alpha/beta fold hydrolase n=1 Tax=Metabacillus lacus TaxID=1983721 RepID=A0A7X2IYE9_9BACI|nr:alpha/beta fold hydrolase [Metabacillus lacus]MRX72107.1 alpha/beta fold hydrolase [Metabacillus lacus]